MKYLKINAPHVVHEVFDDREAAIINLITGNYYSLNAVATKIWERLENGLTEDEIVADFDDLYRGDSEIIGSAVRRFIAELQAEGLVVPSPDARPENVSGRVEVSDGSKEDFTLPELERFGDAQELLLLDPIHDVTEAGFPHRRADAAG